MMQCVSHKVSSIQNIGDKERQAISKRTLKKERGYEASRKYHLCVITKHQGKKERFSFPKNELN